MRLFVFGDVSLDLVCRVDASAGDPGVVEGTEVFYGGRGGNVAVAASRLGMEVGLCAPSWQDFQSSGYAEHLRREGIDARYIRSLNGSGVLPRVIDYVASDGSERVFYHPGGEDVIVDIGGQRLHRWHMVHVAFDDIGLLEMAMDRLSAGGGWVTSVSLGRAMARQSADFIWKVIHAFRYLFVTRTTLLAMLERMGLDGSCHLFTQLQYANPRALMITHGEKGSRVQTFRGITIIPPVKPENLEHSRGAGEAYTAGFLFGLSKGLDLGKCGRIGSTAASFAVETRDPQSGFPDLEKLSRRYEAAFGEEMLPVLSQVAVQV